MWWTHKGSNLGPLPCEGNPLPCLAFARPKNRRRTAAYAAYDFVVSYAIDPKATPSGTRLGPEWHPLNAPCGAPPRTRWKACTRPPSSPFRFTAKGEDPLLRSDKPLALAVANAILSTVVPWI